MNEQDYDCGVEQSGAGVVVKMLSWKHPAALHRAPLDGTRRDSRKACNLITAHLSDSGGSAVITTPGFWIHPHAFYLSESINGSRSSKWNH